MTRRVVVTGMGAVSPFGLGVRHLWDSILAGKSGISTISKFDTTNFSVKIGGEVKGLDLENFFNRKELSRLDDFAIYAIVVWAFTKAPIPMVGALRESSIFFSIFIGYFFLKEKITPTKIFSILLILVGVIGLKLF